MAQPTPSPLQRQVARVSRRLFVQVLLDMLFGCLAGALVLSAGWFLVQPLVLPSAPDWVRWAVMGGLIGGGVVLAVVLAVVRWPSTLAAALMLDERFELRERVTTSLTLAPGQKESPAAAALLADVNQRVDQLDVAARFPVRLSWNAALVPLGGALLALVAVLYEPASATPTPAAHVENADNKLPNADEVDKKITQAKLEKKEREKKTGDSEEDPDLKKFDEDMDRIFGKPRETKEQAKNRVDEMDALKQKMQDHQKELADKAKENSQALKDQLKMAERQAKKQEQLNGPAKDLEKAINQGDLDKAKEEVERLAKKLRNNELTKEEQQQLSEQLKDLKDKLEQVTKQDEMAEQLKELARRGEIDPETLNKELEKLQKNSEKLRDNLKDLEDIAEQLAECQKCLRDGDAEGAARALQRAGAKMNQLDNNGDLEQLARQMEQLEEIRRSICRGLGSDNPVPAAGRRPLENDETGSQHSRITGENDPLGRNEITGFAPGSKFRRPQRPEDLAHEIKQASQEAPEALERQRIPRAAGDITKGYFENLGGQKEPEKKGVKP